MFDCQSPSHYVSEGYCDPSDSNKYCNENFRPLAGESVVPEKTPILSQLEKSTESKESNLGRSN